jgi:hypothetical protein
MAKRFDEFYRYYRVVFLHNIYKCLPNLHLFMFGNPLFTADLFAAQDLELGVSDLLCELWGTKNFSSYVRAHDSSKATLSLEHCGNRLLTVSMMRLSEIVRLFQHNDFLENFIEINAFELQTEQLLGYYCLSLQNFDQDARFGIVTSRLQAQKTDSATQPIHVVVDSLKQYAQKNNVTLRHGISFTTRLASELLTPRLQTFDYTSPSDGQYDLQRTYVP